MKPRLTAVLLHGMGNAPAWWTPFISGLEEIGIAARAPLLPDLATASPDDWIQAALAALPDSPAVLIGHSLGAAVAAGVGVGLFKGYEAASELVPLEPGEQPDPTTYPRYRELYALFARAYHALEPIYTALAEFAPVAG